MRMKTENHIVSTFDLQAGLLTEHDDGKFRTLIYGFTPGCEVHLMPGCTHLGCIYEGELILKYEGRERRLYAGDFFSVIGPATVTGSGWGMSSSVPGYTGINALGGPIEPTGRLRYIDGCTDSLLIPPVRKGDPCLNHLHFPTGITQTPHTHPSVRTGLVYRGRGECIVPGYPPIPLRPGSAFVIPTNCMHSFNTSDNTLDVIAFHPDSDTGMTDDDHPMVNRTMVDGVSASRIPEIRTSVQAISNLPHATPLTRQTRPADVPPSYPQQRLWFLHQLEEANTEHNMPHALRVRGPLDVQVLKRAINAVVARHESLRTRFDDSQGRLVQIIDAHLEIDVPLHDLSELDGSEREQAIAAALRRSWEEPFDLQRGPLIRVDVLKLAENDHIIVRSTHLMVTDGWSVEVLFGRELTALYNALAEGREAALPEMELQYADYAIWQRRTFDSGVLNSGMRYWRSQLGGLSAPLPLPSRRPRRRQWETGAMHRVGVDGRLLDDLRRLARNESVTLAVVWLAAFQILLARWTGERNIPVGVVVANRERSQLKSLMGFFVNFVVVQGDLRGDLTFRTFLRQVAERSYDAYSHQHVPIEKLVEDLNPPRSPSWNPLFQVVFNMLNYPRSMPELSHLQAEEIPIVREVRSTFDLKLTVRAEEEGVMNVTYNSHLFDAGDITALFDEFQLLLRELVERPDAPVLGASRTSQPIGVVGIVSSLSAPDASAMADAVGAQGGVTDERALCELFAEVLERDNVAPDDDFFALGGHSLLVMMLRNRIRAQMQVDLPLRAIFEAPTARKLLTRLHA
jgi:quercetin dioxygenase-like cupin family protein